MNKQRQRPGFPTRCGVGGTGAGPRRGVRASHAGRGLLSFLSLSVAPSQWSKACLPCLRLPGVWGHGEADVCLQRGSPCLAGGGGGGDASAAALGARSWGSPSLGRGRGALGRTPPGLAGVGLCSPSSWQPAAILLGAAAAGLAPCHAQGGAGSRSALCTALARRGFPAACASAGAAPWTPAPLIRVSWGPCSGKRAQD